jgi:hypothetical protein
MGKLISSDPITKTTRSFHKGQRDGEEYYIYNEQDVTHIIEKNKHLYNQDVTHIIEKNKHLYNSYRGAWEAHGEWGDRYAEIPSTVWGDLLRRGIAQDEKRLRKWLDDRDNLLFRCRPGSLSK